MTLLLLWLSNSPGTWRWSGLSCLKPRIPARSLITATFPELLLHRQGASCHPCHGLPRVFVLRGGIFCTQRPKMAMEKGKEKDCCCARCVATGMRINKIRARPYEAWYLYGACLWKARKDEEKRMRKREEMKEEGLGPICGHATGGGSLVAGRCSIDNAPILEAGPLLHVYGGERYRARTRTCTARGNSTASTAPAVVFASFRLGGTTGMQTKYDVNDKSARFATQRLPDFLVRCSMLSQRK